MTATVAFAGAAVLGMALAAVGSAVSQSGTAAAVFAIVFVLTGMVG